MRKLRSPLLRALFGVSTVFTTINYEKSVIAQEIQVNQVEKKEETFGLENIVNLRNPGIVVYSLLNGIDSSRFYLNQDKDLVCVKFDLTDPKQNALALRFDLENCGEQAKIFEKALDQMKEGYKIDAEFKSLDREKLRSLVKKYLPARIGELDDPKKLPSLVFAMTGQKNPSLYDILHDGPGQESRKTRFNEDEISDRAEYQNVLIDYLMSFLTGESKAHTRSCIKYRRDLFDGKAKEYLFLKDEVDPEFLKYLNKWAERKKGDKPVIRLEQWPSTAQLETFFSKLFTNPEQIKKYVKDVEGFINQRRELNKEIEESIITVPEDSPEEVFWDIVRDHKYSVVARHIDIENGDNYAAKKQFHNQFADFVKNNKVRIADKEIAVVILNGYSRNFNFDLPPYDVGIHTAISPYVMYHYLPTAIILKNDDNKISQIGTFFTDDKEWLKVPNK